MFIKHPGHNAGRRITHFGCLMFLLLMQSLSADDQDPVVSFTRDVRPILANACFHCHGPDDSFREAELRLDVREGFFEDRGGYVAVTPGDLDSSALIHRILSQDPDEVMPPHSSNKSLTEEQKQTLVRWVRQGAAWQQHWAFVPPEKVSSAAIPRDEWSRNEIDRFVLRRLHTAGLTPAEEAETYVLVRRLYLDLTGLPPTPAEADEWVQRIWGANVNRPPVSSPDEDAYQQLVTNLMESPAYGERWARR